MNDAPGLSPASELTRVGGPPQPVEVQNFSSLQGPSQAGLPELGSLHGFASSRTSIENRLAAWYDARDAPWIPGARFEDPRQKSRPSTVGQRIAAPPSFLAFRELGAPSECETTPGVLPSDSGYASGHRPSVGNPSIYGEVDRSGDAQSLTGHFAGIQFTPDLGSEVSQTQEFNRHRVPWDQAPGAQALWCDDCKKPLKTKSEKK